jgi:hypothetical protein
MGRTRLPLFAQQFGQVPVLLHLAPVAACGRDTRATYALDHWINR